ncbi:MAG: hypothetical protein CL676_11415 [Bdellovibrionaceae bacterium]|nr:hypothetical protein [Pseudobdellovibrionaceae bacterium]|tara:strand:- start:1721 stop:2197 length:477 start_codon:yes stop_codon:yes gene_type:complete
MKQTSLLPQPNLECGGSLKNTRKQQRTLSSKRPTHLVLKANRSTLFKNRDFIQRTMDRQARKFHHRILTSSIQKNHIHILIRFFDRASYIKFIRALTGLLARKLGRGLWKFRPFTKVLTWGRETWNVNNYIFKNEMEVFGIWSYQPRRRGASNPSQKR